MRGTRLSIVLTLAVLAGGASLAAAAEPVTAQEDPQSTRQTAPSLLPEALVEILTPEPMDKAPIDRYAVGPCSITVTCRYSPAVSCSSEAGSSCVWRLDYSPTYAGYVKCGSFTAYCQQYL